MRKTLLNYTARNLSGRELRQNFLNYFHGNGHEIVQSSSVRPLASDGTLLFTNAGMNQFKDVILGSEKVKRKVVAVQKCIRAGGKHNDLDDVGKDLHHQTFFEMLGNWSFNNAYSKKEACELAWNYLTGEMKIDPSRLYVSYFGGSQKLFLEADLECKEIWRTIGVADSRILPFQSENFWEMGSTGPCGPCTEIHYDRSKAKREVPHLVNVDDSVVEIWNIVFMSKLRNANGRISQLESQHIDTGMGFERLLSISQGVDSNFDTDLFATIFGYLQQESGESYTGSLCSPIDVAFRIIADHSRCVTVAMADGILPGPVDAGFIVRKMLRRMFLQSTKTLKMDRGSVSTIVRVVVESLKDAYPSLEASSSTISKIIDDEERQFWNIVDRGSKLFEKYASESRDSVFSGLHTFTLHDTYGLNLEITEELARLKGMTVDVTEYRRLKDSMKKISQQASFMNTPVTRKDFPDVTDDAKYCYTMKNGVYEFPKIASSIRAMFNEQNHSITSIGPGKPSSIVLDDCQFYAEEGGQKADHGLLYQGEKPVFEVENVRKVDGVSVIFGTTLNRIETGQKIVQKIDIQRREAMMRAHSATHLLNEALRVVGLGCGQRGSSVDEDSLRFDYELITDGQKDRKEKMAKVQEIVSKNISKGLILKVENMKFAKAKALEKMQSVFIENKEYPDVVRVCSFEDESEGSVKAVECCSGTHVLNTKTIDDFVITSDKAASKGVRRVTALTGPKAKAWKEEMNKKQKKKSR